MHPSQRVAGHLNCAPNFNPLTAACIRPAADSDARCSRVYMLLSRAVCRQSLDSSSCCLLMSSENSSSNSRRRLLQLRRILHQSQTLSCKLCSSARDGRLLEDTVIRVLDVNYMVLVGCPGDWLEVGDSRVSVSHPHRPELVPRLYGG